MLLLPNLPCAQTLLLSPRDVAKPALASPNVRSMEARAATYAGTWPGHDHAGPVVITVGFIGYLVAGFPGACMATAATFLPCDLLTILPAPCVKGFTKNASVKAFVDGITSAVVGALVGAVVVIALRSIGDIPQVLIAVAALGALLYWKKLKEPAVIAVAAGIGLLLKAAG